METFEKVYEIDEIDGSNRRNRRLKSTTQIHEIDGSNRRLKSTKSTKSTTRIDDSNRRNRRNRRLKSTKSTAQIAQIDEIDEIDDSNRSNRRNRRVKSLKSTAQIDGSNPRNRRLKSTNRIAQIDGRVRARPENFLAPWTKQMKTSAIVIETPRWTYFWGVSIRKVTAAINESIRNPRRRLWAQGFSFARHHSKSKMYKGHVLYMFETEAEAEAFLYERAAKPQEIIRV